MIIKRIALCVSIAVTFALLTSLAIARRTRSSLVLPFSLQALSRIRDVISAVPTISSLSTVRVASSCDWFDTDHDRHF